MYLLNGEMKELSNLVKYRHILVRRTIAALFSNIILSDKRFIFDPLQKRYLKNGNAVNSNLIFSCNFTFLYNLTN